MLEFILARYNYWIVIILMMTGLYIVFSRGNLVKTVVGLNIFQTSVFIFYITVAKVAGGTAPILVKSKKSYPDESYSEHAGHGALDGHAESASVGGPADPAALNPEEAAAYATGQAANDLGAATGEAPHGGESLHTAGDADLPSNSLFGASAEDQTSPTITGTPDAAPVGIDIGQGGTADPHHGYDVGHAAGHAADHGTKPLASVDPVTGAIDGVVYSNPLPHVLILTAIVVGVATTAVGLALAVRIREAFGTIEEDALERMNNEAEFGPMVPRAETAE